MTKQQHPNTDRWEKWEIQLEDHSTGEQKSIVRRGSCGFGIYTRLVFKAFSILDFHAEKGGMIIATKWEMGKLVLVSMLIRYFALPCELEEGSRRGNSKR